ncbi:MAG TPA: hypothetical protein DIW47_12120 [Bacteroidetes bacterium]|nr:hypothetical protein [Bacteroidota bacterium]
MKRTCQLSLLFLALLFSQCRKEMPLDETIDTPSSQNFTIDKGKSVLASFAGKIINEAGFPVYGANITIGDKAVQTNSDGFFFVKDASVFENHAYIRVFANNYFHGSRSVLPKQGVNQVNITLLSNASTSSFPANTGGTVTVGKAKVEFGAGYTDDLGIAYSGEVKVAMKYLDPEAANLSEIMPGDLVAASSEGTKLLESFGMVAVELKSTTGAKLQLAKGNEATIRMGLSPIALSKAPEELPLWYFDEAKGHWVEEGSARLIDGEYVGKVKHFSFWNCDVPRKYNRIDAVVKTTDGSPLAGVDIHINSRLMGAGHCMTSSKGAFGGRVPSGELFHLNISYMSQGVFKSLDLGPFSSDQVLSDIIIGDIPGLITLSGQYATCDNKPMQSGMLFLNDQTTIDIVNGTYSFKYPANLPFTLRAHDHTNLANKKTFTGYPANTQLPLDSLCNKNGGSPNLSYQISYEIDGITTTYKPFANTGFGYAGTNSIVRVYRFELSSLEYIGNFELEINNYSGTGEYIVRHQNRDSLWIGNYNQPKCSYADSINVRVKDYFIKMDGISMDIDFSGILNVWNEQLQVYEKKELKNGHIVATK